MNTESPTRLLQNLVREAQAETNKADKRV